MVQPLPSHVPFRAWFDAKEHVLQPPLYGFDSDPVALRVRHQPEPSGAAEGPTHLQRVVHVTGDTLNLSHLAASIKLTTFIRGARWRGSIHPLCTALEQRGPEVEPRMCSSRSGSFHASLWLAIPGGVPKRSPGQLPESDEKMGALLDRPCQWALPMVVSERWRGEFANLLSQLCSRRRGRPSLAGLFTHPQFRRHVGVAQVDGDNLLALALAFGWAVRTCTSSCTRSCTSSCTPRNTPTPGAAASYPHTHCPIPCHPLPACRSAIAIRTPAALTA